MHVLGGIFFVTTILEGKEVALSLNNPRNQAKLPLDAKPWNDRYNYQMKLPYWVDNTQISEDQEDWFDAAVKANAREYLDVDLVNTNTSTDFADLMIDTFDNLGAVRFDSKYMVGLGFAKTDNILSYTGGVLNTIYLHFNGQHFHTAGQALNLASNTLYRYFTAKADANNQTTDGYIRTTNQPMNLNNTELEMLSVRDTTGAGDSKMYFDMGFVLGFLVAITCANKLTERMSKSKHIQGLTGLSNITYWMSFYLVDIVAICLILVPIVIFFLLMGDDVFGWGSQWVLLWLYCFFTCCACLPQFYVFQKLFESTSYCIIVLMMSFHIICSTFNLYVSVYCQMNQEYNDTSTDPSGEIRAMVPSDIRGHDIMLKTIPHYTFFSVIDRHFSNNASLYLCTQSEEFSAMCVENNITYSDNFLVNDGENGVGEFLPLFGLQIVIWLVILLVLEFIEHYVDASVINRYVWYLSIFGFLKLFDDSFSTFVLMVCLIVEAVKYVKEYLGIKAAESETKRGSNKVSILALRVLVFFMVKTSAEL